jgi:prepilin-type N-terminal cleavage/methylation domain-containing protein
MHPMRPVRPARGNAGFTLIEVLVAVAILAILLTLGMPALDRFIHRGKLEGVARQTAALLQVARFDAIKHSAPGRFVFDYDNDLVHVYTDMDSDGAFDAAVDRELGRLPLPVGVTFRAAGGDPEDAEAIKEWNKGPCPGTARGGCGQFEPNGSVDKPGKVRFGDERGNYLEVRVATAATGRLEIGKAPNPGVATYETPGENGKVWEWY